MVHNKHQKSKPTKHPQIKKHGKQTDISEFRAQLDAMGLKIIQVTADGNCFFRALADQLEGNEEEHEKYRHMVVQYIAHKSPRWYIRNFDNQGACMIHLSYHDGEHYNSVRLKEDPCDGSARPIIIKADVNLTASMQHAKVVATSSKSRSSKNIVDGGTIKMVMAGSGCEDADKAEQVLRQVAGDVDAAIEFLIAEQAAGETVEENNVFPEKDSNGDGENSTSDKIQNGAFFDGKDQSSNVRMVDNDNISCKADKKIPRNKVCPCGSKKKYKACCGTAASGKKLVVNQEPEAAIVGRGKRGKKQGKEVVSVTKAPSHASDEALPDMGALCI